MKNNLKLIIIISSVVLASGCSTSEIDIASKTKECLEIYEMRANQQPDVYDPQPYYGEFWDSWHQFDVFYDEKYKGCIFADLERTRYTDSYDETKKFIDLYTEEEIYNYNLSSDEADTSYELFSNWEIDN